MLALLLTGLCGWTRPGDAQAGNPQADAPRPASGAAKSAAEIVLLDDGRMVSGVLSEEDNVLIVTQPIGAMRFPKKKVEKVFGSIREVYEYKLERLPEDDFDERLKLARWCLRQYMEPEARSHLQAILDRDPKHSEAKAMMVSLDQTQARLAMRNRDPEVHRSAAEKVQPPDADRPGSLDASVIYGAKRGLGISDLPVVFDLPPAQAVKRADQFTRYVHPVLQTYCARCHNERYDGEFQLVQVKNKRDRTRETLRANLDATLKLVDPEDPRQSKLLSSSLLPHGRGANPRPIFQGSNDKAYQILAAWVNSLQSRKTADGKVTPAGMAIAGQDGGEPFAVQRSRISRAATDPAGTLPPATSQLPVDVTVIPPMRYDPAKGLAAEGPSNPDEFPVPFAVSGKKPKLDAPVGTDHRPDAKTKVTPGAAVRGSVGDLPPLPPGQGDDPANGGRKESAPTGTAKKESKIKFDPAILQRALQLRNQNR